MKVHDKIVKIAELLLTFLVFEALNRVAGNQVQFQMIDLRLVYIVLFSSLYGINYGLAGSGAGNTFIAGSIYENRDRLDDTFLRTFELDSVYLLFCSRRDLWLHPTEKQR